MPERVRALERLPYGPKFFAQGEEFTVSAHDANMLVAARKVERVKGVEPTPAPPAIVLTREMTAEGEKHEPGRPRKYARRDMRAKN